MVEQKTFSLKTLPLVSLIIPCYNAEAYVEEMLVSIQAQTFANWECIIVDDHSTDNSQAIIRDFKTEDNRFKLFNRPESKPKGGNSCRNYGFTLAEGEFINWIDADDILHPDFIGEKISVILAEPTLDFVISQTSHFNNNFDHHKINEYSPSYTVFKSEDTLTDYVIGKIIFFTFGPMWRKTFLEDKELFDESIYILQEWEFYIRLLLLNPKFEVIDKPLYFHRRHVSSITGNIRSIQPSVVIKYLDVRDKGYHFLKERNLMNRQIQEFYFRRYLTLFKSQIEHRKFTSVKEILKRILKLQKELEVSSIQMFKLGIGLFYFYCTKRNNRLLIINI